MPQRALGAVQHLQPGAPQRAGHRQTAIELRVERRHVFEVESACIRFLKGNDTQFFTVRLGVSRWLRALHSPAFARSGTYAGAH